MLRHPVWTRNATLYQVNLRHFTSDGTIRAATDHLPRLKALGADILWLMPIHPIGEESRKGELGSPYAVRDHYAVNPDLGTLGDLRAFVDAAHGMGMRVILDWVANHTAWDHVLRHEHPDWYARDQNGNFRTTPWWDWTDVIDLDWSRVGVRRYMGDAMVHWVREADVDGFRCDVAGFVPLDFWESVRRELETLKPVFMLAEWESRDLHHRAFDATYAWSWHDALLRIARSEADVRALLRYYSWRQKAYPPHAQRMTFVSNHDMNAWEGTALERFGDALAPAMVLSVVGDGIPMVYGGQEAGSERRLPFFHKDAIEWREHWVGDLYTRLFALKHRSSVLANAPWGAPMVRVPNDKERRVLSFVREHAGSKVFAVFNLSPAPVEVSFRESLHHGDYTDWVGGAAVAFRSPSLLELEAWEYRVLVH